MNAIMGIDPGKDGAISIVYEQKNLLHMYYMLKDVNYDVFETICIDTPVNHIFLEKAQCMPKNGARGMFNYGTGFGKLLGWIESVRIPYTLVAPQSWTKVMQQGCTGRDSKAKSLQAVQRLFPDVELRATQRCKKPHLGIVDALLIAEYGRRQFK